MNWRRLLSIVLTGLAFLPLGCTSSSKNEVVVYCALDREFAEPILKDFEKETGVRVLARYDVEATKSVGLTNVIIQEKARPRCDLFWNNEILNSLRLYREDALESLTMREIDYGSWKSRHNDPDSFQTGFPSQFHDAEGYWYSFAARARVLLVNTELVLEKDWPKSIDDLIDPRWQGKVGMAKPLFGTTATHAAVLFATRGDEKATEFFRRFKANGKILSGNKQVAQAVASGQIAFGITDTDDAILERDAGRPVEIIFPDQGEGQSGTLLIPNTIALPTGTSHHESAKKLAKYLLTASTEDRLAKAASAQIPLHPEAKERPRVLPETTPKWMQVDFSAAAAKWEVSQKVLGELFTGP